MTKITVHFVVAAFLNVASVGAQGATALGFVPAASGSVSRFSREALDTALAHDALLFRASVVPTEWHALPPDAGVRAREADVRRRRTPGQGCRCRSRSCRPRLLRATAAWKRGKGNTGPLASPGG